MVKKIYKSVVPERQRIAFRAWLERLAYPLYLGDQFYCNCCGKGFRKFHSKGNIKRANAKCPYCGSLERTRVLDLYLDKELKIYEQTGIKVLHIAPEACLAKKLAAIKEVTYIDGDINPAYASHVVDITDIPYEDAYFDLVICSHVLGHVPDEAQAIRELRRVLKKDGLAIIMTILDLNAAQTFEDERIVSPADRLKYYSESDLCRLHGLDFPDRLRQSGFKVTAIDYRTRFSAAEQKRLSLGNGEREVIYRCVW